MNCESAIFEILSSFRGGGQLRWTGWINNNLQFIINPTTSQKNKNLLNYKT